jgi:hypothetical protein
MATASRWLRPSIVPSATGRGGERNRGGREFIRVRVFLSKTVTVHTQHRAAGVERGSVVEFSAALQKSDNDEFFGFFSRPSKAKVIKALAA